MKAIETRLVGPTNYRGLRIVASDCDGNRVAVPYHGEQGEAEAHHAAATALCEKMNWTGPLVGGSTKAGMAFVFLDQDVVETLRNLTQWAVDHDAGKPLNPYTVPAVRDACRLLAACRGSSDPLAWNE